ncbi:MAG TPA: restriction endonuclease subunit S [Elusimicrobiota bacterium]|nr:restriction endonuclease subunit S [Elusimicrobiota bacterium]
MKGDTQPLAEIIRPRKMKVSPSDYPDLPYVGLEQIEAHTTRLLGTVPATEMKSAANYFESGDVLYSRLRPYLNKVWRADRKGLCSSEFIVFPGNEKIDSDFLRYRLNSHDFVAFATGLNAGDRPRVDFDQISVFQTWLPKDLAGQRKIVAEIEKQFTRLEAGVAALRRVQASLKRYRAAVLKAACEGRLVPTEAELAKTRNGNSKFETGAELLARILAERHKNWKGRGQYKEPAAPDTAKLPPLPKGWAWATVDQLADIGSGNTPAKIADHVRAVGPIPWFKVGDMNRQGNEQIMRSSESYMTQKSAEALGLKVFPSGTIIFPKRGGAIATNKKRQLEAPATTDLNVMALTPHCDVSTYFKRWFASIDLSSLSDGSNVPQVNNKDIQPLPIPLPPLAEQTRIVAEVERRLSVVEELEAVVSANLQRATRLRQSILQKAFTGALAA